MKKHRIKLTRVSSIHYFRLVYRSGLFLWALVMYILSVIHNEPIAFRNFEKNPMMAVIWLVFMIEMVFRFFPSKWESPGCQKQFRKNYKPTGSTNINLHDNNGVMIVAIFWIILNGTIGGLHMTHILDDMEMLLICLVYSVCDMICILFFCPFQTWILKNRCCVSCRIYNWDYAMMFTPLFFIPGKYTWTLMIAAIILLIRWEFTIWRFPERFSENTNQYLACKNCTERLCTHKTQLKNFKVELVKFAEKQAERILTKIEK